MTLSLVGFGMRPEAVTELLEIAPTVTNLNYVRRCGSERKEECGLWCWDTAEQISSRDLADHLDHLVRLFGPLKSRMEEITPRPNVFVHVRCEPAIAMRGMAPRIEARHVAALADLGAALTVEILNH